ncbi:MAG: hypothetical protein ACK5RV_08340 [Flavobacterium sp.]|jgi:hypothetical protein|uniref:hypothetical protein n=1 Tax=Flavobacterium sp. TaxID=239 RepID=UPI0022BD8138|nr:hypothetical protein [Flavobacterium sp.]MCZ8168581.1 hypothetical protein [Flavobacterium sp.]MCZ8297303.1 hypothetical protein [Flavobacterium sp.]
MKINKILLQGLLLAAVTLTSCGGDDDNNNSGGGGSVVILEGNLESRTLSKNNQYLIKGQTFVRSGNVLTIEPGTIIKGDKATKGTLIIDRGGRIEAVGTASEPIVMTSNLPAGSRDRGDWGGLIILGNAPVNQVNPEIEGINPAAPYGGTNAADDSGALVHVRVEYAGIELTPNNETNSITLGAVGTGTQIEYCQVSYGGDDGFEWFGGTVNGKYLISFANWDDSFDVDFGYSGKNQFGLEVRYPSFADQSGSNSFECDNGPNDNVTTLLTTGVFSNFTCIGPRATNAQSINANFQHSIDLRRRTAATIANSVFIGYPRGLRMNQQSVYDNYAAGTGKLIKNILVAPNTTYSVGTGMTATVANIQSWFEATNTTITAAIEDQFAVLGLNTNLAFGSNVTSNYAANPNFAVTSGLLTSGAEFTDATLNTWFTATTYRGAFGATDWTDGWAEFLPNSKTY